MYLRHNFEHASCSNVSQQASQKRIIVADAINCNQDDRETFALNLHRHTYSINTDPLEQFAVVFTALIHDLPNRQLATETPVIARASTGSRQSLNKGQSTQPGSS
jgi:hypothetical protein